MLRTHPKTGDYCFFCHGRRDGVIEITEQEMCDEHLKQMSDMAAEHLSTHPDGQCTPDCGCISLAELERRMGLDGRSVPTQDS